MKREQQGLHAKQRIDQECMKNAIETIRLQKPFFPAKAEGKTKDNEKVEKYNKMLNFLDQLEQDE